MKILPLIPARGGSKGLPGKNIKELNGKPLIAHSIESALKSKYFDTVFVSTDDYEIKKISERHGATVPFVRPAHLATSKSSSISVIQHFIEFQLEKGVEFDAVCLLQCTSPFRRTEDIDNAIDKFVEQDADSLISVINTPEEYNPYWSFVERKENDGLLKLAIGEKIISRRQDLPASYTRNGCIYIAKNDLVLKQNTLYGNKLTYYPMDMSFHCNIDTIEDWKIAEKIAPLFFGSHVN